MTVGSVAEQLKTWTGNPKVVGSKLKRGDS